MVERLHLLPWKRSLKSTWERNLARVLDHLGVKWEYESARCRFDVRTLKGKSGTVKIDFYLPDYNAYLEPHSFMDDLSTWRFNAVRTLYPNTILTILDSSWMKLLEVTFSSLIDGWEYGNEPSVSTKVKLR